MEAKRAFDDAFYERLKKRIANRFNTDPNRDECMFCPTPIEPGEQACTYCIEDLIPKEPMTIEAILKKHPKKKKDYKRMTIEESLLVLWGKNK